MISHRSTLLGALGLTAALFLASCGSTDSGSATAQAGSSGDAPAPSSIGEAPAPSTTGNAPAADPAAVNDASATPVASDFPDVDVLDVRTGDTINLRSLAPRDKPALLWFYAPH